MFDISTNNKYSNLKSRENVCFIDVPAQSWKTTTALGDETLDVPRPCFPDLKSIILRMLPSSLYSVCVCVNQICCSRNNVKYQQFMALGVRATSSIFGKMLLGEGFWFWCWADRYIKAPIQ